MLRVFVHYWRKEVKRRTIIRIDRATLTCSGNIPVRRRADIYLIYTLFSINFFPRPHSTPCLDPPLDNATYALLRNLIVNADLNPLSLFSCLNKVSTKWNNHVALLMILHSLAFQGMTISHFDRKGYFPASHVSPMVCCVVAEWIVVSRFVVVSMLFLAENPFVNAKCSIWVWVRLFEGFR